MASLIYRTIQKYRNAFNYRGQIAPIIETGSQLLPLQGVLNKLAGTTGLGEDDAANVWLRKTHPTAPYLSMLGALNYLNGTYGHGGLGLNLVCCELAGVRGFYATQALNILANA